MTAILDRHQVNYTLEWFVSGLPFLTQPAELTAASSAPSAKRLDSVPEFSTTGGTSDGRFIAPTGAQVVELGVVNATIHKVNECVRVEDIDAPEPHVRAHHGVAARHGQKPSTDSPRAAVSDAVCATRYPRRRARRDPPGRSAPRWAC